MFCEKCGTQLPDNAKFCTNCGTNIAKGIRTNEKIPDTEIQLRVKPAFKFGYMVLPLLIIYIIPTLFFSVMFMFINPIVGIVIALIGFVILVVVMGIKVTINKKQYDNYTYDFYKTKVIYKDSFLYLSEKEVKYKYIREVTMRQTFIQRYFNIGDIVLYSNAESGVASGVFMNNIENVDEVYQQVKEITNV